MDEVIFIIKDKLFPFVKWLCLSVADEVNAVFIYWHTFIYLPISSYIFCALKSFILYYSVTEREKDTVKQYQYEFSKALHWELWDSSCHKGKE